MKVTASVKAVKSTKNSQEFVFQSWVFRPREIPGEYRKARTEANRNIRIVVVAFVGLQKRKPTNRIIVSE